MKNCIENCIFLVILNKNDYLCVRKRKISINICIKMKNKSSRQDLILEIISKHRVRSQEELVSMLSNSGLSVTQATLSRDLKELQLAKIADDEGYYYRQQNTGQYHNSSVNRSGHIADGVHSMEFTGNLALIKTEPGFASVISSIIDKGVTGGGVMGTVSGDDTLLVVIRENTNTDDVVEALSRVLPGIEKKLIKL